MQIYADSPLDLAEIQSAQQEVIIGNQRVYTGGDILLAIDGTAIISLEQLETVVESNYLVGDMVTLTLVRGSGEIEMPVQLMEEPNG